MFADQSFVTLSLPFGVSKSFFLFQKEEDAFNSLNVTAVIYNITKDVYFK